jgi:pimeloyl-ACP methyl ester carboxylesterase
MRLIARVLKWLGLFLIAALVALAVYQRVGLALDADFAPPPGEIVNVHGRAVHVACMGQGSRTYLLDAGAGAWSFEFARLQPRLAARARVCAFDRPGLGWSDEGLGRFDAASLTDEVHAIVEAAKIPKPFVYIGHSLGANIGEIYATRHPQEVAALVLIEPGFPKWLLEDFTGTRESAMAIGACDWQCDAALLLGHLGLVRLAAAILEPGAKSLPVPAARQYRAGLSRPQTLRSIVATLQALPKTAHQIADIKSFGATPVLTLASERPFEPEAGEPADRYARALREERDYLTARAKMSAQGQGVIVVPGSNHGTIVTGEAQSAFTAHAIESFVDAKLR